MQTCEQDPTGVGSWSKMAERSPKGASPAESSLQIASSPQKKKLLSGDICPFAIPLLRLDLDKGDAFDAVRMVAEICALLTQFRQLSELWLYQVQARDCVKVHLAKHRCAAEALVADSNMLTAAIAKLEMCDRLYQLCDNLGLFVDVAYEQHLQPLGSSWDVAVLPLHKYSTNSAKISGTNLWKKYMRRRIQQYNHPEEVEIARIVDTRFAIPLQAFCRRFVVKEQSCILSAAVRRALAREDYKDLPLQYRSAAARIQASLKRKFLLRRYDILRDACVEHSLQIMHDWKKLPAAKQLEIYKYFQHQVDPKDPELDAFQAFAQNQAEVELKKMEPVKVAPKQNKQPPPPPPQLFEEEELPPTTTFRNTGGPNLTGEQLVGRDVHPEEGMRIIFAQAALEEFPDLFKDSGGGVGTITWVDPEDADGDGVTGDICEVLWDKTGLKGDYRTGFEGHFRLAMLVSNRVRKAGDDGTEKLVGLDVEPFEGMKVVLCQQTLEEFPEYLQNCGGTLEEPGVGVITWVDPEDADGDGIIGDICEVQWQKTGIKCDYRTGFEGDFRLALSMGNRKKREGHGDDEDIVGIDSHPRLGMRVVLSKEALSNNPELFEDCCASSSGLIGAGIITWIDEEDHDGDGHTGDICEVEWERTGKKAKYDTGLDGNFSLAETVPLQNELAGMKLQAVFRGHRSRRVLRNSLITKFLQEKEMEEVYGRFLCALQLQNAARSRQARLRVTFERILVTIYARENAVDPDPHIKVPLKVQSVFRGHVGRGKLRSAILSIYMIKNNVREAWEEQRYTRAYIKKTFFILHTHPRVRSWRNHTVRILAHVRYHAEIEKRFKTGLVWHAFCYWMQHSLDAKDRVDFVSLLIHRTWKHMVYMQLMKDAVYHWGFHTKNILWLEETRGLVFRSHERYLMRLNFEKTAEFELISRQQRESAFRLRARITFVMCVATMREWHIGAWRRIVMRNVGDLMLPCWVDFLMWRCFCGLKFNGRVGEMILSRAEISKFTLQQKFASVSKLSQSALIRNTKKQTGVKGPTIPLPQYVEDATAARTATAMLNNDTLYRPLLVSKTFPYPTSSSVGGSSAGVPSDRSGVSTPAFGSAGSANGRAKKKPKKRYKTNEEIEAGFWDARSKALLANSHHWEMPVGTRKAADTMRYTTMLPDLTRRPVRQSGDQILAEKFGIEPKVLMSLKPRPHSQDFEPNKEGSRGSSPAARPAQRMAGETLVPRMAWETLSIQHGYDEHPDGEHPDIRHDTRLALRVAAVSPVEKKRHKLPPHPFPRFSTALGRLENGRLPPL